MSAKAFTYEFASYAGVLVDGFPDIAKLAGSFGKRTAGWLLFSIGVLYSLILLGCYLLHLSFDAGHIFLAVALVVFGIAFALVPFYSEDERASARKIGAQPDDVTHLNRKARKALDALDDSTALCLQSLANISTIENGTPTRPLLIMPPSSIYEMLGITASAIAELREQGILSPKDHPIYRVEKHHFPPGDYDKENGYDLGNLGVNLEYVRTWSASGYLDISETPGPITQDFPQMGFDMVLIYPDSPLRYTKIGQQIATICGRMRLPDTVSTFSSAFKEAFTEEDMDVVLDNISQVAISTKANAN